ncbi:MAG: ATP-binding protein [Chloroflexi bacterium]|nr:ATP-binding protein [Chloroflexota bacterium]
MTTATELTPLLKRLKLRAMLNTLPERIALARREELDYASFLQVILTDEVNRRDRRRLEIHLQRAGFDQVCRLEDPDWSAFITLDRRLLDADALAMPEPPVGTFQHNRLSATSVSTLGWNPAALPLSDALPDPLAASDLAPPQPTKPPSGLLRLRQLFEFLFFLTSPRHIVALDIGLFAAFRPCLRPFLLQCLHPQGQCLNQVIDLVHRLRQRADPPLNFV